MTFLLPLIQVQIHTKRLEFHGILKKFPPRSSVDELKEEIKEYDTMLSLSETNPNLMLRENVSDYA